MGRHGVSLCFFIVIISVIIDWGLAVKPGDVIYTHDFRSSSSLAGWSNGVPSYAHLVQGGYNGSAYCLRVTASSPSQTNMISISLPNVEQWKGSVLQVTVTLKAENVTQSAQSYNGIKTMVTCIGNTTTYTNAGNVYGTFDWSDTKDNTLVDTDSSLKSAELSLGLQSTTGTVYFDSVTVSVYASPPPPPPPPPPGPPYTGHPGAVDRLRGMMSPQSFKDSDMQVLGSWGANLIRWQMEGSGGTQATNITQYWAWIQSELAMLDQVLPSCHKYGIMVVVDLHQTPGGLDTTFGSLFLKTQTYQDVFTQVWTEIAKRYLGNPAVYGYDLANEPHLNEPGDPGVLTWQGIAQKAADTIRTIDPYRTIIVESLNWDNPDAFTTLVPLTGVHIVYQVHMYEPHLFTHQGVYAQYPFGPQYPGMVGGANWNIDLIRSTLQPVRNFQLNYNVHIYVGEFSAVRWANNHTAINYIRDCISVFESYGWDWSYHAFREWQGWSVEYGDIMNDTTIYTSTPRKELLLSHFKNNINPYTVPFPSPAVIRSVSSSLYLSVNPSSSILQASASTPADATVFTIMAVPGGYTIQSKSNAKYVAASSSSASTDPLAATSSASSYSPPPPLQIFSITRQQQSSNTYTIQSLGATMMYVTVRPPSDELFPSLPYNISATSIPASALFTISSP
eukprot:TRINITY_DN2843_c0_g1_i2.p1 TRINITY_DN2843_c0_g1~~TRINITY_DN2843_c0_g1_i2.p1  ORF type:complete len:675 (-),score=123.93 TRINITY_DN2843_c0_g1_i2:7-2031(-)